MSIKNIYRVDSISDGGCVVHFKTDSGLRSYKYGREAAKKISNEDRDPREFKSAEIKIKQ